MKKENKNKAETENKTAAPVVEAEKEEKEILVNQDKVGSLMHEARLKKGLKIADASRDLCIRSSYLEAIEAGNYDEIPEPPYGIGFIRSYADYLGLNSARMVQLFKEETDAASKNSDYYVMEPQAEVTAPNKKYLLISLAAVFVVYAGWFFYNESQNSPAEETVETPGYTEEASDAVVDFPLQVEDFAPVEENVVEENVGEETLPVVDVAPVSDGAAGNVTVSEASFVEPAETASAPAESPVEEPVAKPVAEEPAAAPAKTPAAEVAAPAAEVSEPATEVVKSKKPGSRVTVKIKGEDNWIEVRDANKLYISKVLHDGDVYEVPAGEGMILSVGRVEGADVYIDGKLTEVVKPNKKTGIALDPFLASANH